MSLSFLKSSTLAAVASLTLAACSHIATFTGTSGAQVTEKGGVSKSMLALNESIIDIKEG